MIIQKASYLYYDNKATTEFTCLFPRKANVIPWLSGMHLSKAYRWCLQDSVVDFNGDGFTLSAGFSDDFRTCTTGVLMQGRRETISGNSEVSATYLRCLISRFFFFSFIFVFLSFIRCLFFFLSCLIARSSRQGECRRCWLFSLSLFVACYSENASSGGCSVRPGQTLGRRYGGVFW